MNNIGIEINVTLAAQTVGAVILRYPIARPRIDGHIVISDGQGGTIEAKSRREGVVRDKLTERRWDTGVLVPSIEYEQKSDSIIVTPPTLIFRLTSPMMRGRTVREIQRRLKEERINPGRIDGIYGPQTIAAVIAYQRLGGLLPDGEVGIETAAALGIAMP